MSENTSGSETKEQKSAGQNGASRGIDGSSVANAVIVFCLIVLAAAGVCVFLKSNYSTNAATADPNTVAAASNHSPAPASDAGGNANVTNPGGIDPAVLAAHPELNASVTYQLPGGEQTLDGKTMINWLVPNGDGTYTRDEATWNQHLSGYVAEMADSVDTINRNRTFHATDIGDVTLNTGGYYGWVVDQDTEAARLSADIESQNTVTREPAYSSREVATTYNNCGIGQSYAEIDLSRQHMWIYKDGVMVFDTDIVSGQMDEAHYTPEGVYLLLNKEKDAILKGDQLPDGSRTYEQPVSYWMPITNSGIGLHDASWKNVFGGLEYINNGSHGCINLPPDVAGTVYDLITMSMPIVLYYSQPYELREAPESALEQYYRRKEDEAKAAGADTNSEAFTDADGDGLPDNISYADADGDGIPDSPSDTGTASDSSGRSSAGTGEQQENAGADRNDPKKLYPICDNGLCDTDGNGVGDTDPSLLGY
uniref:L,D-transpeptidase family protein n=1 Tax=Eubacterium cellulosolvens TaxID=29322 RepID=UPI0006840D4B|nr:L,D-transpeptidase family protein [[Eubacterium] cellulosolvens]